MSLSKATLLKVHNHKTNSLMHAWQNTTIQVYNLLFLMTCKHQNLYIIFFNVGKDRYILKWEKLQNLCSILHTYVESRWLIEQIRISQCYKKYPASFMHRNCAGFDFCNCLKNKEQVRRYWTSKYTLHI